MSIDSLFGSTINLLGKSLDLRVQNHNRITANIANAETPGYVPTRLSFDKELQDAFSERKGALVGTDPRHISASNGIRDLESIQGRVVEVSSNSPGIDGNGVELENEMSGMVDNQIMYNADIHFLTKKFAKLTMAIKGGN